MKNDVRTLVQKEIPYFWALPALLWQIVFLCIPITAIILASFLTYTSSGLQFTLQHYRDFFSSIYLRVILRSLILAVSNGVTCFLIAYPIAYYLAFKVKRFKNILLLFLIVPFWTSLMVQVYSWFFVLERYGLINSLLMRMGLISSPLHLLNTTFSIYLVMAYCYLPFMIFPLYTVLEKIDRKLFEASADLGATSWDTFKRLTLPLSLPGIKTGFFLVFVPSFGELVVPVLLGGGKQLFVGPLISYYFLASSNAAKGGAFTCLSSLALGLVALLIYWFFHRKIIFIAQGK